MLRLKTNAVAMVTVVLFLTGYSIILMTGASNIRHLIDKLVAGYLVAWGLYAMLFNLPRAELGKRFILTTLTIITCFLLAEGSVLLGAVDYRPVFGTFDVQDALGVAGRRFDPQLVWVREPYYHFEADYQGNLGRGLCVPPDPSKKVKVQYDRNGFRNSRDLTEADIVVIGDSYIESSMTPDTALSTSVLSMLQGKTVANLGNSGYGPQQELEVLKRFGLPLMPKTVIWAFFEGNDLSGVEEYDRNMARLSGTNGFWQDFWFRSLSRNILALYFRASKECVPSPRIQRYRAEFTDQKKMASPIFFAPPEYVDHFSSEADLGNVANYIAEAEKLCRERNIRFIVVFVPDKHRVYLDLSNVALGTEEMRAWRVDELPYRLQRVLAADAPDMEFVDLTPPLRAESHRGIATYLPDDTHWTPEGHRVVAEAIHQVLLTRIARQNKKDL